MAPEDRVKQFAEALSTASSVRGRDAALRAARQVIIAQCLVAIGRDTHPGGAIAAVIREAAQTGDRQSRRVCALLIVHALGVPGLIPPSASADVCALAESGIRSVLHRCGYPFAGSATEKMAVLERLHRTIGELMQPLEPTFPNWQGLYAG
jgi:hypothetical protein